MPLSPSQRLERRQRQLWPSQLVEQWQPQQARRESQQAQRRHRAEAKRAKLQQAPMRVGAVPPLWHTKRSDAVVSDLRPSESQSGRSRLPTPTVNITAIQEARPERMPCWDW